MAAPSKRARRDEDAHGHGETDDTRIRTIVPMVPPACLMQDVPSSAELQASVAERRAAICAVLHGDDDRVLLVAGPCTVHDPEATLDYARKLAALAQRHAKDVLVVLRLNFREGRGEGWKGFLHDPHRDGSFATNQGLQLARQLMVRVASLGLAVGTSFHDALQPQFFADLVSWLWVAPHATTSQVHHELASGLSMPVAFCDCGGSGPDFSSAAAEAAAVLQAQRASRMPHAFLSVSKQGVAGIVHTNGNSDVHAVIGGAHGDAGPDALLVRARAAASELGGLHLCGRVLVDCSCAAGGSGGGQAQAALCLAVAAAIGQGEEGVCGVQLKSFLLSGRQQDPRAAAAAGGPGGAEGGPELRAPPPVYGLSVTDACIDWAQTAELLRALADAARHRRSNLRTRGGGPRGSAPGGGGGGAQPLHGGGGRYAESASLTDNLRVRAIHPLLPPACLACELPCPPDAQALVARTRAQIGALLAAHAAAAAAPAGGGRGRRQSGGGTDGGPGGGRLLVVVGPPVVHDPQAALEYGGRLRALAACHGGELLIVMAASFERSLRGGAGWKGLVNDPHLDGSFHINAGLRQARRLLLSLAALGLPTATEFGDTILPQYLADLTSYSAYDCASSSSRLMSELASGLSMPVGVRLAADPPQPAASAPEAHAGAQAASGGGAEGAAARLALAVASAHEPHVFLSVSKQNLAGIVHTEGNEHAHAILVGSAGLAAARAALSARGLPPSPLVDCALPHEPAANGGGAGAPLLEAQRRLVADVMAEVATGGPLLGVYLPSFLREGRQDVLPGRKLAHGVSVGSECFGWAETASILQGLADAVKARNGAS